MFMHIDHPPFYEPAYWECITNTAIELYDAFDSMEAYIMTLIGYTFDDGEPHVQYLLSNLTQEDVWKKTVGVDGDGNVIVPCPLKYSEKEMTKHEAQYNRWCTDVQRRRNVLRQLGVSVGWDGAVDPDWYCGMEEKLADAKWGFFIDESMDMTESQKFKEYEKWDKA
ncbi:hypothetical protein BDW69DRAFT_40550 [Aspergillus filifer]